MLVLRIRANETWRAVIDRLSSDSAQLSENGLSLGCDRQARENFLAFNILTGAGALALLPLYIASHMPPSGGIIMLFLALSLNLILALAVSRSKNPPLVIAFHAAAYSWVIGLYALTSGGVGSYVMPALLVLPVGGMLLKSRNAALTQAFMVFSTIVLIGFLSWLAPLSAMQGVSLKSWPLVFGLDAPLFVLLGVMAQLLLFAGLTMRKEGEKSAKTDNLEASTGLASHAAEAIYSLDEAGGIIEHAGGSALPKALQSRSMETLREHIHIRDLAGFMQAVSDCVKSAVEVAPFNLRVRDASGHYIRVRASLTPASDGVGGSCKAILRLENASQEEAFEAELEKARTEVQRAAHVRSRFLSCVSHELRTPLNAVIGFSDILAEQHFGNLSQEQVQDYARIIHSSGQNLLQFVNQIIDLSRIEGGSYDVIAEPFQLAPVLNALKDEFAPKAQEKCVLIVVSIAEELPEMVQDRRAFSSTLKQILANAVKFSPIGGTITVIAKPSFTGVEIAVTDEGPGLPEGLEMKLSEPFAKFGMGNPSNGVAASEGAGFGLAIARALSELMGGRLSFTSATGTRAGMGTTVSFYLPAQFRSSKDHNLVQIQEASSDVAASAEASSNNEAGLPLGRVRLSG